MSRALTDLSLVAAAEALARGECSSEDLTRACLGRIERLQPALNAFAAVFADRALAEARARDAERAAGHVRSPLHGIPLAHKDAFDLAGLPTSLGCDAYRERIARADATAIARLQEAGAVCLGKLNLHECCYGITSDISAFGPVRNPWDRERVAGGSSGGSAVAVAARLCFGSLGTDTGGSVRAPAAMCGVVGLKPTYGRISRFGVPALAWSLDHVGIFARRVDDVALLLHAIAGPDRRDPTSAATPAEAEWLRGDRDVSGFRLGVPREHFWEPIDPEVATIVRAAIGRLGDAGAEIREISWPAAEWGMCAHAVILAAEAAAAHRHLLATAADRLHATTRVRLAQGFCIPAVDYVQAQRARTALIADLRRVFATVDVLLTPTCAAPPPRFDDLGDWWQGTPPRASLLFRCCGVFNLAGVPAISVPCGLTPAGLPVGLQIVGPPFAEGSVLQVARALEAATEGDFYPDWVE